MARNGLAFKAADFISRTLPAVSVDGMAVAHAAVRLVQALDALQEANPAVTFTFWVRDGIWVSHDGLRLFMVLPRKGGFRVLYRASRENKASSLHKAFKKAAGEARSVKDIRRQDDYHLWALGPQELGIVIGFMESLPAFEPSPQDGRHPRNFPGPVRQLALEMFERDGRWCSGAKGRRPHKVDTTRERIEFDHILPDAKGGSRSALNVQVLCEACNRAKGGTAM